MANNDEDSCEQSTLEGVRRVFYEDTGMRIDDLLIFKLPRTLNFKIPLECIRNDHDGR
jgi:hypothetical protein